MPLDNYSMPWGYRKRHRSEDYSPCGDCGDGVNLEEEDYTVCAECQDVLCSACGGECAVCKDIEAEGGVACCESCMAFCDLCTDAESDNVESFHKMCKTMHVERCTALSRSVGAYRSAKMRREEKEKELAKSEQDLARIQIRIQSLTKAVQAASENEANAKAKMDAEQEAQPAPTP